MRSKGQILNFDYHGNFKDFNTKLCLCSHTDRKHIDQNFHPVCSGHAPGIGLRGAGVPWTAHSSCIYHNVSYSDEISP